MNTMLTRFLYQLIFFFACFRFGIIEDEQFKDTVLKGVESLKTTNKETSEEVKGIKTQQETLMENYEQLHKDTKSAMEELNKVKNANNGFQETLNSLKKLQLQLNREQRMAFGDPVERILANEEHVLRINAAVRKIFGVGLTPAMHKALGEDSSPGSTLINDELGNEIYDTLASYGKWATLGVQRMGTKITKLPVKTARPIAYGILTEGGAITPDTNSAGGSVNLDAEVIAALLFVSEQLLMDSEFNVAADVLNDFREAFNYRLDYMVFSGDGTEDATNVGCTGIFEAGTAATAAAGNVTVEQTDLEDWTKCQLTVDEAVLSRSPKWWMHRHNLIRAISIKDLNGRSIFQTALEAPSAGSIGSILGDPVETVSAAPNTNTTNSKIAVYGDPEAYKVGIRQDFTFDESKDYRFNTLERAYRCYGRADGKMRRAQGMSVLTLPGA